MAPSSGEREIELVVQEGRRCLRARQLDGCLYPVRGWHMATTVRLSGLQVLPHLAAPHRPNPEIASLPWAQEARPPP